MSVAEALRHCVGCGVDAPDDAGELTLISARYGWRLTRRRDAGGGVSFEWRCPTCAERARIDRRSGAIGGGEDAGDVTARFRLVFPNAERGQSAARRELDSGVISKPEPRAQKQTAALTVLCGPQPGRIIRLEREESVIGRDPAVDVFIDHPSLSRRHAVLALSSDGGYELRDLGSTNGTFVSHRRIERVPLSSGDRVQIGPRVVLHFSVADAFELAAQQRLNLLSSFDALTGALDRTSFSERLQERLRSGERGLGSAALLLLRVDGLEPAAKQQGQDAADALLRTVAIYLVQAIRGDDILGRTGGDELVIGTPAISTKGVLAMAERLRVSIASLPTQFPVTVSIGVALCSELGPGCDAAALLGLARNRLDLAVRGGGDRIVA